MREEILYRIQPPGSILSYTPLFNEADLLICVDYWCFPNISRGWRKEKVGKEKVGKLVSGKVGKLEGTGYRQQQHIFSLVCAKILLLAKKLLYSVAQ